MTREDMIERLRLGNVDVDNFDRESIKTLDELFEEISNRDVNLMIDSRSGRAVRCAVTTALLIEIPSERKAILETSREYARGAVVPQLKEWSLSETCKRGEELYDSAVRGVKEELGLTVYHHQLSYVRQEFRWYESRVYKGVVSSVLINILRLSLPKLPWTDEIKIVDDNGTKVRLQLFNI